MDIRLTGQIVIDISERLESTARAIMVAFGGKAAGRIYEEKKPEEAKEVEVIPEEAQEVKPEAVVETLPEVTETVEEPTAPEAVTEASQCVEPARRPTIDEMYEEIAAMGQEEWGRLCRQRIASRELALLAPDKGELPPELSAQAAELRRYFKAQAAKLARKPNARPSELPGICRKAFLDFVDSVRIVDGKVRVEAF